MSWLAGFFGVLALTLVGVGLNGVIVYIVSSQQRDIGIRMALGGTRRAVVVMVLRQVAWLTVIGCAAGVGMGLLVTHVAAGLLFGITPHDPASFGIAVAVLLTVSLGAAYLPGRRAARTDPATVLRAD